MKVNLSFESDIADRLAGLPEAVAKPVLLRALKKAAAPIQARAAALAPRSNPDAGEPGHLGDHIGIGATSKVDGEPLGDSAAGVAIGPTRDYFWASVQEFGPHDGTYSAHPFMRPAFDGGLNAAFDVLTEAIRDELMKAADKGFGAHFTSSSVNRPTLVQAPGGSGQL
jgi:hypothetical protein